ncbi:MAG TPA: hypothetical protein VGM86_29250 [Thermoanaerobaculia bacterium]
MSLEEARKFVSKLPIVESEVSRLPGIDEPLSETYLSFALADLEDADSERSLVNALSNAKRAIHRRVDSVAKSFGVGRLPSKERKSFPQLLEFCRHCGVIGPRIVAKLNRVRNEMEHEYYLPSREEAEDFVDVTELFIAATDVIVYSFPERIVFSNLDDGDPPIINVEVSLPMSTGSVSISGWILELSRGDFIHLVAEEIEKIQNEINLAQEKGSEVLLAFTLEEMALLRVARARKAEFSGKFELPEDEFYEWASLCVKAVRRS